MPVAGNAMRRVVLAVLPLVVLAACDGEAAAPSAAPAGPVAAQVRAWFPPHGIVDTIEIDVMARLPSRDAVLIAPNGSLTPANYVHNDTAPSNETGQWAAAHSWQNPVTGDNAFAALTENAQAGAAVHAETQLLAILSTADLPLPDPVAYRRDWSHYRIRLTFGAPPAAPETEEIAAPAPPPAAQQE
ncbi:MAG TPA: hypothetical protein VME41_06460 [Stellaceae bacterium]|nr:hypothetical protein [Stellaceae bacterium]